VPFLTLDAADEKNRQGNAIPLRADLAADLRDWLGEQLRLLQADARERGEPIPARLPPDTPLFTVPSRLERILDRDLRLAGIPKRDDRGRTLDVHALRHTFGTLMSKGGVPPRTAQAAMRHGDIRLTMNVYTDPKLLDVRGALDVLPSLPLDGGQGQGEAMRATGTDGTAARTVAPLVAPTVAPTADNRGAALSFSGNPNSADVPNTFAVSGSPVKRKEPLTTGVSGSSSRGDWIRTSDLLNPIMAVCRSLLRL
jgi:hypothetical protein